MFNCATLDLTIDYTDEAQRTVLLKEIRRTLSEDIFEALYCPSADSVEVGRVLDVLASTARCASFLLAKIDKIL